MIIQLKPIFPVIIFNARLAVDPPTHILLIDPRVTVKIILLRQESLGNSDVVILFVVALASRKARFILRLYYSRDRVSLGFEFAFG